MPSFRTIQRDVAVAGVVDNIDAIRSEVDSSSGLALEANRHSGQNYTIVFSNGVYVISRNENWRQRLMRRIRPSLRQTTQTAPAAIPIFVSLGVVHEILADSIQIADRVGHDVTATTLRAVSVMWAQVFMSCAELHRISVEAGRISSKMNAAGHNELAAQMTDRGRRATTTLASLSAPIDQVVGHARALYANLELAEGNDPLLAAAGVSVTELTNAATKTAEAVHSAITMINETMGAA